MKNEEDEQLQLALSRLHKAPDKYYYPNNLYQADLSLVEERIKKQREELLNLEAMRRMIDKHVNCTEQDIGGDCEEGFGTCIRACKKQVELEDKIKEQEVKIIELKKPVPFINTVTISISDYEELFERLISAERKLEKFLFKSNYLTEKESQ